MLFPPQRQRENGSWTVTRSRSGSNMMMITLVLNTLSRRPMVFLNPETARAASGLSWPHDASTNLVQILGSTTLTPSRVPGLRALQLLGAAGRAPRLAHHAPFLGGSAAAVPPAAAHGEPSATHEVRTRHTAAERTYVGAPRK